MKLEDAIAVADDVCKTFENYFEKYRVVGSIRRKKQQVNDIDIVAIPRHGDEWFLDKIQELIEAIDTNGREEAKKLGKSGISRFSKGNKIKRFECEGIMIDLYIADERTYETLVLIRTGSEDHNKKLTNLAIQKGMKLFANGSGLCKTTLNNGKELITETIENTENGILQNLLGKIPDPQEREV